MSATNQDSKSPTTEFTYEETSDGEELIDTPLDRKLRRDRRAICKREVRQREDEQRCLAEEEELMSLAAEQEERFVAPRLERSFALDSRGNEPGKVTQENAVQHTTKPTSPGTRTSDKKAARKRFKLPSLMWHSKDPVETLVAKRYRRYHNYDPTGLTSDEATMDSSSEESSRSSISEASTTDSISDRPPIDPILRGRQLCRLFIESKHTLRHFTKRDLHVMVELCPQSGSEEGEDRFHDIWAVSKRSLLDALESWRGMMKEKYPSVNFIMGSYGTGPVGLTDENLAQPEDVSIAQAQSCLFGNWEWPADEGLDCAPRDDLDTLSRSMDGGVPMFPQEIDKLSKSMDGGVPGWSPRDDEFPNSVDGGLPDAQNDDLPDSMHGGLPVFAYESSPPVSPKGPRCEPTKSWRMSIH